MDERGLCVIDANIFVKGVLSPHGPSGKIIQQWRNNRFILIASKELLSEIYRVLSKPKITERYEISEAERRRLVRQIYVRSIFVTFRSRLRICRDPKDDYLIEAAILGSAKFLVTDDNDLLQDQRVTGALSAFGIKVVRSIDFQETLRDS